MSEIESLRHHRDQLERLYFRSEKVVVEERSKNIIIEAQRDKLQAALANLQADNREITHHKEELRQAHVGNMKMIALLRQELKIKDRDVIILEAQRDQLLASNALQAKTIAEQDTALRNAAERCRWLQEQVKESKHPVPNVRVVTSDGVVWPFRNVAAVHIGD